MQGADDLIKPVSALLTPSKVQSGSGNEDLQLTEGFHDQVCDNCNILPFIVSWQQDRVLAFRHSFGNIANHISSTEVLRFYLSPGAVLNTD
jgi:hypothetical protein